jgi:quinol monooxygenase YgiN
VPKVAVLAKITAQAGQRDALVAAFQDIAKAVDSEEGTLVYAIHTSTSEADVVWFYELYTDQDAFTAHRRSDAMKAAGPTLAPLMAGQPEVILLDPVRAKGLSF